MLNVKKGECHYSANMSNPEVKELKIYLNISELTSLIQKLKGTSDRIVLCGICAEGTDTKDSDVDLFVLTADKESARAEIRKFKTDRKILPVIADITEFMNMKQRDRAFYDQVNKGKELWRR